mmetsp:Transcript_75209/g.227902  ORF Transcript_75209/g.227902 Transcript_75209/m.227902 type:complete len:403 (-) Transcript_75209:219-1427(-)
MVWCLAAPPELHELQVWTAWFEQKVVEAAEDGMDNRACKAALEHAQCILCQACEARWAWETCGGCGQRLPELLAALLQDFGVEFSCEFEGMQRDLLQFVQVLMQQELLRLYYKALRHGPERAQHSASPGLPLAPGDAVWYLPQGSRTWTPAVVLLCHADGSVLLDAVPKVWVPAREQAALLRPRARFEAEPPRASRRERSNAAWAAGGAGGGPHLTSLNLRDDGCPATAELAGARDAEARGSAAPDVAAPAQRVLADLPSPALASPALAGPTPACLARKGAATGSRGVASPAPLSQALGSLAFVVHDGLAPGVGGSGSADLLGYSASDAGGSFAVAARLALAADIALRHSSGLLGSEEPRLPVPPPLPTASRTRVPCGPGTNAAQRRDPGRAATAIALGRLV